MGNSVVAWRGRSQFNDSPIMLVLSERSTNVKTRAYTQSWILSQDHCPTVACPTDTCGDCPLSGGDCYNLKFQAPRAIYRAAKDLPVDEHAARAMILRSFGVRWSSYGDLGALPRGVAQYWARFNLRRPDGNTGKQRGYSHQWRVNPWLSEFCLASVESELDAIMANLGGFKSFRITRGEPMNWERRCPAADNPTIDCATCSLCDAGKDGPGVINAPHGNRRQRLFCDY